MTAPTSPTLPVHQRAEFLDFLLEVSRIIAETLDLDERLAAIAQTVREVIPYDLFAILLYSEKRGGLVIRYSIGHREEIVRNLVIPLNEGIVGAAAAKREPVLAADVRDDPRYLNALDAVRSELAVPMMARGRLVGVLDVQSTEPGAYSEHELSMLTLIASRVGISVDNARLYRRVEKQNHTLRTLAQLSREFSSILDLDELLARIARAIRTLMHYDAFGIFLVDEAAGVLKTRFSARYDQRVYVDNIPLGKGLTGAAVEARAPVRVADTSKDERYVASHEGIRSSLTVPLIVKDRVVGVVDVESERPGYYSDDHERTLSLLAQQIAVSVENARLYEELAQRQEAMEQDLKAARRLQRLLRQAAPELHNLEVAVRSRPAREVSGDLYDFFETADQTAVIAFGDVSGKGAAAALFGALITGLLRTIATRRRTPALLMRSLNEKLLERKVDAQYATLMIAFWEPITGQMRIANAGSSRPLVARRGELLHPQVEGVPIGLLDSRDYDEIELNLEPGDAVLLYSDGVEDQPNAQKQEFSRERIGRLLTQHAGKPPKKIADAIIAAVDRFRGATPVFDDQTVVVLRVPE